MQSEFDGQCGVITGAARGLGFALCRLFAERGGSVVMIDLDRPALEAAAARLQAAGATVHPLAVDLTDEDAVAALPQAVEPSCGRVDVLINNAGGWRHARSSEITLADWDWTFRTNLLSAFLTTRALMGAMVAQRGGRIVNVASTDAHRAKVTLPHYAAAKAALVSLTRSFAEELAPHQVLVNAVSPGAIATETARAQDWFAERLKTIPLGRAAEPEDIAEVVLFLASPRNRFVVGQTLMVNGGIMMN